MSGQSASRTAAQASYHPSGYNTSPSLKRARKPFITRNLLTGTGIVVFAAGVYWYSISAVKQDDFSDVADLLPPLEERGKLKSIEDEEAERKAKQKAQFGEGDAAVAPPASAQSLASSAQPSGSTFSGNVPSPSPGLISDGLPASKIRPPAGQLAAAGKASPLQQHIRVLPFLRGRDAHGSIVNGAVDVDRIGSVWDDGVGGGRRLV